MLSRLNVRNKLLVILLPLLVAVAVLASIGVVDRLGARDDARQDQELVTTARSAAELINQLQLERLDAVARRSAIASDIADPQVRTDAAGSALLEQLDAISDLPIELDGRSLTAVRDSVQRWLDRLADVRSTVAAGTITATGADAEYTSVIDAVLDTTRHLVAAGSGQDRAGASSRWVTSLAESDARSGSLAIIVASATRDGILDETRPVTEELASQRARSASWIAVYLADTDQAGRTRYDGLVANDEFVSTQGVYTALNDVDPAAGIAVDPSVFLTAASVRGEVLWSTQQQLLDNEINTAKARVDQLEQQVRLYVGGAVAALLLGLLLAAVVTRLITTSLRRLTRAARTISEESLPRLVDSLKHPETDLGLHPTPIDVKGADEFVQLANAFGVVEQTAIDVAAEQAATLRKGIGEIFVNLARRNQSLLDRQIEFIDRLEANEEDPDQLENLFKLDHLATRMRRNAESLLVLAGAEAPRRRGREVSMTDVIRVAVGEVEDFARVTLLAVDDAMVVGTAAVDIAHLLSELMENGTQYSPPDRRVEVVGHRTNDGGYVISVTDHGVGMSDDARLQANELLATPPAVGLALSRSLGFVVASTLASRHGIAVRLTESPSGGITALVTLGSSLILPSQVDDGLHPAGLAASASGTELAPAGVGTGTTNLPAAEDDWMASLPPLFAEDEPESVGPLAASFDVASATPERSAWQGTTDSSAPLIEPEPLSLGDDPLAVLAEIEAPQEAPAPPTREATVSLRDLGSAFEAGVYSPVQPGIDGETVDAGEAEAAPRTTMWSSPGRNVDRPALPPLPGIPTPGSLPTSIPPSISADLSPALTPDVPTPPPLPSRADGPVPIASPMTPLLGDGLPQRADDRLGEPGASVTPVVPAPLPQRKVATAQVSFPAAGEARVGAPNRPADEIRSILSAYRSGLSTGRTETVAEPPPVPAAPPVAPAPPASTVPTPPPLPVDFGWTPADLEPAAPVLDDVEAVDPSAPEPHVAEPHVAIDADVVSGTDLSAALFGAARPEAAASEDGPEAPAAHGELETVHPATRLPLFGRPREAGDVDEPSESRPQPAPTAPMFGHPQPTDPIPTYE